MPIANPLVQAPMIGDPGGYATSQGGDDAGDTLYAAGGAAAQVGGVRAALGGNFTGAHNTSSQVAILVLASLGVIVLLHIGGFRFAVDAGLTGR